MTGEFDRRAEVAEEQGIRNPYMTEAAASGVWPDQSPIEPAPAILSPVHHVSHRGGRSYPEGHPDQQPEQYVPPTDEEIAARDEALRGPGRLAARQVVDRIADNAAARRMDGDDIHAAALARARRERPVTPWLPKR